MADFSFESDVLKKIEGVKPANVTGESEFLLIKTRGLSKAGRYRVLEKMKENGFDEFESRKHMKEHFQKQKVFSIDKPYKEAIDRYNAAHRLALLDLGHEVPETYPTPPAAKAMRTCFLPPEAAMMIQGPKTVRPKRITGKAVREMDPPSLSYLKLKNTHGAHFPKVKPMYNFFQ
jgi:hypothetical protein